MRASQSLIAATPVEALPEPFASWFRARGWRPHAHQLALLEQAGFTVLEVPEGHICCGSAGTYNLLEPELSGRLRERKLAHIASVKPDVVATGNIGCMTQLERGSPVPVVHTIELLDWATGGPCPKQLQHLKSKVHPVEALVELAAARDADVGRVSAGRRRIF